MEGIDEHLVGAAVGRIGLLEAAATTSAGGEPALMLRGSGPQAVRALERIAAAHGRIDSPRVPKTLAAGRGYVVLDVDAVASVDRILRLLPRASIPYEEGIVVTLVLVEALAAAHRVGEVIGGVGTTNLLLTRRGELAVVGFGGYDVALSDGAITHPTVGAGGAATPATDVYATVMFIRSLVSYVAGLPAPLAQLLGGAAAGRFSRAMFRAVTLSGELDGARSLALLQAFWRTMGVAPDEAAVARRLLAADLGRAVSTLRVGPGCAWFVVDDGARVDLSLKRAQRAILEAFVDAHARGVRLSVADLVAAGWPGEQLKGTSGPDRFYTAVASLRSSGLREVLERTDDGYGISTRVQVHRSG